MATTFVDYTGDGNATKSFSFPSIKEADIKVKVDDVLKTVSTHYNITSYTTTGGGNVVFTSGNIPASPADIHIYRDTDVDSAKATYTAGSSVKAGDLNNNHTQLLYGLQEEQNQLVRSGNIKDAAVITSKIKDLNVTRAKIANDAIDGTKIADDSINSEHYVAGSIDTEHIADAQITHVKLANDSVDGDNIQDDVINSEHYAAVSIDTEHIANENITTAKLENSAVTTSKLANVNVTTAKIADSNVTTAKIADSNVTTAKIANLNVTRGKLEADAVDSSKLADNAVDSEHYIDGSIDRVHLEADIIDSTKLADNAVNSEHYVDGSIDHVHLANDIIDGDNIQNDVINSEHYVAGSIDREHLAADIVDGTKIADDAVGAEHIQANAVTDSEIATGTLDNRYFTETELTGGALDGRYFTETESDARYFNIASGETIKDGDTFPDNDTTIATTAAINDRIIDIVNDVGGFDIVDSEQHFPNTNPQGAAGSAAVLSIKAASTTLTPSGTTLTISNGNLANNANITITGVTSAIPSGFGFLVESTNTLHTYTFHRLVPKATEVTTVAGNISNINAAANNETNINAAVSNASNINSAVSNASNISTVAGISSNVTSVANNASNINSAVSNASNINSAVSNASNINAAVSNASNINAAVSNASNINSAVSNASNITTTATNVANVNTVGTNIAKVNSVAAVLGGTQTFTVTVQNVSGNKYFIDGAQTPVLTLARGFTYTFNQADSSNSNHPLRFKDGSGNSYTTGVTTSGTAGSSGATVIIAVAANAPSSLRYYCTLHGNGMGNTITVTDDNIGTVAGSISNVNTTAGSISNVNTTATNIASVNTTASNIANVNNFTDKYQIASSNPSTDGGGNALAEGDLYFNTTANELKVYNGGSWQGGVTASGNFASTTGNTFTGDNVYQDNAKLKLGTGSDLEIFHNSSDSVINDVGTGALKLQTGGNTKLEITGTGTSVTGNIVVSGNVDGRDVAADGTKLDGIESSATADQTVSEIKTLIAGSPLDASHLAADSVGNSEIASNAVTTAKIGNNQVTSDKISALNANKLVDATVSTAKLALGAVTGPKIANDSIDSEHYVDGSIDTAHIANLQVTSDKIANTAITTAKLATNSVSGVKIANDSIEASKLSSGSVTLAKIADNAITNGKINSSAAIAGTKISPDFGSQNVTTTGNCFFSDVTLENAQPSLILSDNNAESDFAVQNRGGVFTVRDIDNNANRFQVASDGTTTVEQNLDVGAGVDVTGNITVSGTVDGVDIAALNTTVGNITTDVVSDTSPQLGGYLDTNGNNIVFGDSSNGDTNRITMGAASGGDLKIFHDGSNSFIENGTGIFLQRADDIRLQNAAGSEVMLDATANGAVKLYHDGNQKLRTESFGTTLTGNVDVTNGDIKLQSDGNKITFGAGADLKIYHSGNNSFIEDAGTGSLVVKAEDFYVQNASASHTQLFADANARVELSHNGTAKFQTTADGVKVLGTGDLTLPAGTTAQRSGSASAGSMRYNTTTAQVELYNGSGWVGLGKSQPVISSVSNQTTNGAAGTSMVIKGEGFVSGATVHYVGTNGTGVAAGSVAYNSSSQLTAVSPALVAVNAPYAVKVTNPDGGLTIAAPEVEVTAGSAPNWTTSAGQLGGGALQKNVSTSITVAASDADSQAITYSETTSILTSNSNTPGSTMNLSLNSSTGVISGTTPNVSSDTTYNFTLRATDTATNFTDRNFYIIVNAVPAPSYWFRGTSQGGSGLASGVTFSHTGYYPNASGGSNANADRLYNYGQGTGSTGAGFRQTGYTNAITIPVGHDRCDIYVSQGTTSYVHYHYINKWTSTVPSGNNDGTLAFGQLSKPGVGLHTYTIPSGDQGQVRYFVMSGYGGQNTSWSSQVTLVKTYNQANP